jgi:tRNA (guanine37-N1)-methyltransferase
MVVTRLFLRLNSLPLATLPPKLFFPKLPLTVSLCYSTTTTQALTQTRIHDPALSYGPSLHKGTKPQAEYQQQEQQDDIIDEQSFIRVFDLAALRVPAKDCFALESRLRGHLLNWPRIRNIARVPGDEVDPEVIDLLGRQGQGFSTEEEEEGNLVSLERRIYGKAEGDGDVLSPVLYRDKLARTFNSQGYVRFRNLARISRPKRKKKRREEEERSGGNKGIGKNETALVEVVEGEEEGEELKGLLGDEFKGKTRKWKGSTRLLLLDERYAARDVEDLPEAIKVKRLFPTL